MRYTIERFRTGHGWEYWADAADEFSAYRWARIIRNAGYAVRIIDGDTGTIIHSS